MMTQRMVVGPTSKAAAMDGNAILREPSSPTSRKPAAARRTGMRPSIRCEARGAPTVRCAESSADPALEDATMGRFAFHTSPHRRHVDYPKGDRSMRQLWVLVSLAGLFLAVATPATAQVVSLGTLRAIDPKD